MIGIDLGTSNSAVASVVDGALHSFAIQQRISETATGERPLLPSFLYLPGAYELPPGSLTLPWDAEREYMVGEYARWQGSRVPGRVVVSAKSWLAHRQADPSEDLLPWEGASDAPRVSPVEASKRYLQHLRESWDHAHPDKPMGEQEIVLTVPASFDELARELTLAAAHRAGLEKVRLLEEPQAAFYSWLHHNPSQAGLNSGDLVLVCDIGGGTTDFTLIEATEKGLERKAVGEHLMLGGDNLDIALAHQVEPRLGAKLDLLQWGVLRQECRRAKELLLGDNPPETVSITVPGTGARLLAGALSAEVNRAEVEKLVLDGFFPQVGYDQPLQSERRMGLKEWGLPYASDPAVPRHLSSFLRRHGAGIPGKVLFNGGACSPQAIRSRVLEILTGWRGSPVEELPNPQADQAVARGAAWYAWLRKTGGQRIRGGTARSYYLGVEDGRAVCVIPRNLEPGNRIQLEEPQLRLTVDRPVRFPLFSSSVRPGDKPGALVEVTAAGSGEEDEFHTLPAMETVVRVGGGSKEIPVLLSSEVTEIGTLSIGCQMVGGKRRFRLEFPLRGEAVLESGPEFPPEIIEQSQSQIRDTFLRKPAQLSTKGEGRPRSLLSQLEHQLGVDRQEWSLPLLRALWEGFYDARMRRRVEVEYEAAWLNGAGYCLRPGIGSNLDEWRCSQMTSLYELWLQHPKSDTVRLEWWVMWRRISAGLSKESQDTLFKSISPAIVPGRKHWKTRVPHDRSPAELTEVLRLAASLERIPTEEKALLGETLMDRFTGAKEDFWRMARIGARQPFGGGPQHALPPDVVAPWVTTMLTTKWADKNLAGLALAQMARQTGDRKRDLPEDLHKRVEQRLEKEGLKAFLPTLRGEMEERSGQAAMLLGEALPVGLRLGPREDAG